MPPKWHNPERYETISTYCAGKISRNDWRQSIFPALAEHRNSAQIPGKPHEIPWNPTPLIKSGRYEYAGPFFIACGHGCAHGPDSHGLGAQIQSNNHGAYLTCGEEPYPASLVVESCLSWLSGSDVVFCWLDSLDACGTLFELGHAIAQSKPVGLYYPKGKFLGFEHTWFARVASSFGCATDSPLEAWHHFTGPEGVAQRIGMQWWFELPDPARKLFSEALQAALKAGMRREEDALAYSRLWLEKRDPTEDPEFSGLFGGEGEAQKLFDRYIGGVKAELRPMLAERKRVPTIHEVFCGKQAA